MADFLIIIKDQNDLTRLPLAGILMSMHIPCTSISMGRSIVIPQTAAPTKPFPSPPRKILLPNISEPLRLVRIIRSIRPRPRHRRPALFLIPPCILPPDQAHVDESEKHARYREADFDARAARVSRAFGGGEKVAGADAGVAC
jgi:hypothetical protein